VLNIAHIIKHVMTSATEAELAASYIIGRIIHHGTRSGVYQNSVNGNGPQATFNTIANRQCHSGSGVQRQDTTYSNQSNGHAIPLVMRQTIPRAIQNILETGQVQLCRLLDETSPINPPQTHKKRILNTTHSVGNVKNRTKQRQHSSQAAA